MVRRSLYPYLNPSTDSNDISICNLDCSDLLLAWNTIKSAFIPFVGEFWRSFLGGVSVSKNCIKDKSRVCRLESFENWIKFKLFKIKIYLNQIENNLKEISNDVALYIAEKLKLDNKMFSLIGYQINGDMKKSLQDFECAVLIVDISNNSSLDLSEIKINSTDFFDELLIDGTFESLTTCTDLFCDSTDEINNCKRIIISGYFLLFVLVSYLFILIP